MRLVFIVLFILINCSVQAKQEGESPFSGLIEVAYNKSVQLVFIGNEYIVDNDFGSVNAIAALLSADSKKLKLKANKYNFKETNVLVETNKGFYNFKLIYNENPEEFIINAKDYPAVVYKSSEQAEKKKPLASKEKGNIDPLASSAKRQSMDTAELRDDQLEDICKQINNKKNNVYGHIHADKKSYFYLSTMFAYNDYIYFKMILRNESSIPYDIDFLRYTIEDKKSLFKKTSQKVKDVKPEYIWTQGQERVGKDKETVYILAFKKFTIDEKKELVFEIWEKGGARNLRVDISSRDIIRVEHLVISNLSN